MDSSEQTSWLSNNNITNSSSAPDPPVDPVIDPEVSLITTTIVVLVLLTTCIGNFLQRLNNSYWFSSDSILAIVLGFIAAIPLCGYNVFAAFTDEFDTVKQNFRIF
jgi:hypothetical protein